VQSVAALSCYLLQGDGGIGPLPLAVRTEAALKAATCRRPIAPDSTTKTSTTTADHPFTLPLIFIVFPPVLNLRSNLTKATRMP